MHLFFNVLYQSDQVVLQPGNKGVVYVHASSIILPLSHPVHFDTEDGGNILLRSGFIAQEYRTSQRRIH